MSVDDLHGLDATTTEFRSALTTARDLKTHASVEPPLSASDYEEHLSEIGKRVPGKDETRTGSRSMVIEAAARNVLFSRIAISAINDADFVDVWNLLDLVQFCADKGYCEAGLTLRLIEELLDGQTIDGCRGVFDYLESRCERLVGAELTQNKRNTILRTCNELLHRLSRAEDAVFCGRVFIFLFKIFPLGDKSAVNLRAEYHTENVTNFDETTEGIQADEPEPMAVDSDTAGQDLRETEHRPAKLKVEGTKSVHFDILYPRFWSLQEIFSNPPTLFQSGRFESFRESLEMTLQKFKAVPKVATATAGQAKSRKRKHDERDTGLSSTFNPKYLTSKDLFKLEVSDVTFQRHILVQALILIEFVLSLTASAKKKGENIKTQRSMLYNYTLSEEDAAWAIGMRTQIGNYLRNDGEGRLYHRMVDTILTRDKNWVRWKMESCQPISRPPVSPEEFNKVRNDAKRAFGSRKVKAQVMGSIDLGFLAEDRAKDHMAKLRSKDHARIPELHQAVADFQESRIAEQQEKEARNDPQRASKAWRALRLAAQTKLALFSEVQDATEGLDTLLKQDIEAPEQTEEELSEVKAEEQQGVVAAHGKDETLASSANGMAQDAAASTGRTETETTSTAE